VLAVVTALTMFVIGVAWAKWLPYTDKVSALGRSHTWDGESLLGAEGTTPSWSSAWSFALSYTGAVWRALLVSLLVAAAVDALVPRRWLLRVLRREGSWRQATAGGLASLPTIMCTCCTAPLVVTMRRSGVPVPAALAYWLGNPLLNPAVLVFLFLAAPWQWGATRLVIGAVVVVGVGALVGSCFRGVEIDADAVPSAEVSDQDPAGWGLVTAYLRSLFRLTVVLVPEYVVVVLLVGGLSGWASQFDGLTERLGLLGVLVAASVGALLVLPTGGEIPVLLGLSALGAGSGPLGALLVTLPALSLPSLVMVARALSPRVAALSAVAVVAGGLLAGGLLTALP
jgi:uncharacterized membrane protein YraQ (UPF0718 family)